MFSEIGTTGLDSDNLSFSNGNDINQTKKIDSSTESASVRIPALYNISFPAMLTNIV
jgi:hypothetical protein